MRHTTRSSTLIAFVIVLTAGVTTAWAACPPSCPLTGGGDATQDCHSEFASTAMQLNSPFHNPNKLKAAKEHRCFDGDAGCDLDGVVNNECVFDIDVCLRNEDPELASCTAADVTEIKVAGVNKFPGLGALQTAIEALLPATTNTCTDGQTLTLPVKGPNGKGAFKRSKAKVGLKTATASSLDKDQLRLSCVPHRWPSHGYSRANQRSSTAETKIGVDNVTTLKRTWRATMDAPVTSTPTVDRKLVYTTSWDGQVSALSVKNGKVKWTFDTASGDQTGVQSSVTLTPEGRVVVGDSNGNVYALTAKKGDLLWTASVADTDLAASHIWGSPTVANGRVFVGRASHNDQPCTAGHLYAFDLDTGAELWRYKTVGDNVCFDDTTVECVDDTLCSANSPCATGFCTGDISESCANNGDCGGLFGNAGTCVTDNQCALAIGTTCVTNADCPQCVEARGGGVTTTPAISADGETVYFSTVGCLSFPSVGNSDAIIALDAATGAETWVHRTQAIEQFDAGPYHDYGFLNGPLLTDVSDGGSGTVEVAIAGGKDGTLYAVETATGSLFWSNVMVAAPPFAGFGLFNGAIAFADDKVYAALAAITGFPASNDFLWAFDGADGVAAWSDAFASGWGDTTIVNGVLYAASLAAEELLAYDAATGVLLHTFTNMQDTVVGGVSVVDGRLFVPIGLLGSSASVVAYELPK